MHKNIFYILVTIAIIATIGYGVLSSSRDSKTPATENRTTPQKIKSTENAENINGSRVKINLEKSIVRWTAKKTMVTTNNHNGTIQFKEGFVILEDSTITGGEFIIDMKSLSNTDLSGALKEKLERHLNSNDFFATEAYPTSRFFIKDISATGNSQFIIKGDLTIKDITNEVTFPATIASIDENVFLNAEFEIDRTRWDIRFGSGKFFENLGNDLIDDTIGFTLEISTPKQ
jgi:polyisoprenoid-binding protein YceI